MSSGHQRITRRRNIAENFNRLSRVHERYRQTTDDRQTDGRTTTYSEHEHEFTFAKNGRFKTSDDINQLQLSSYQLTGPCALVVSYIGVSNDSSFRHIDHDLTVVGLCCINLDFKDSQHISGSRRFTHDVVGTVDCLRDGVCHKIYRHVECCWYWDIQWYTQPIIAYRYHTRYPFTLV